METIIGAKIKTRSTLLVCDAPFVAYRAAHSINYLRKLLCIYAIHGRKIRYRIVYVHNWTCLRKPRTVCCLISLVFTLCRMLWFMSATTDILVFRIVNGVITTGAILIWNLLHRKRCNMRFIRLESSTHMWRPFILFSNFRNDADDDRLAQFMSSSVPLVVDPLMWLWLPLSYAS